MAASSALKARTRADYPHIQKYTTRFLDNDIYGHLNNVVYYHLFDSIVNAYLYSHCDFEPHTAPQIGLVVHSDCDYFGSVAYPDVVDVGLRVRTLGRSSVTYEVAVFKCEEEAVKVVGTFVHVFVDRLGRKVVKEGMEKSMREALEALVKRQSKL